MGLYVHLILMCAMISSMQTSFSTPILGLVVPTRLLDCRQAQRQVQDRGMRRCPLAEGRSGGGRPLHQRNGA